MIEDCPELLAKLEEKRGGNIHMIIVEPCDEVDHYVNVRVITRGGARMGEDAAHGPLQAKVSQYVLHIKDMVRKATTLPTFNVQKQKEVMFEARREFDARQELGSLHTRQRPLLQQSNEARGNQVK